MNSSQRISHDATIKPSQTRQLRKLENFLEAHNLLEQTQALLYV